MKLHIDYCKGFGISVEEIEGTEENMGEFPPTLHHGEMLTE